MAGRWFDASLDAESWGDEQLQAGCLREVAIYDDDGAGLGAAFIEVTCVMKSSQIGVLCNVEYLGATWEDYPWSSNFGNARSPGATTSRELVHFCRCCSQLRRRSD